MAKVYIYVVDRDLGFAPNPFHGYCTLATCKPDIRNTAKVDDWVVGVGGGRLKATGKCIFAMKVTEKLTYNDYWLDIKYNDKKPVRNGSKVMLLGDNIYNNISGNWSQAHSHHSHPDGTINVYNLNRDTKSFNVLVSNHFYYFGKSSPIIPEVILNKINYKNSRKHRIFHDIADDLINWIETDHKAIKNLLISNPYDFDKSGVHYSVQTNKMTKK